MMIAELTITDFAIIDRVQLQLAPGFNVLTGETGAGKSIIVDALSQLLGSRADTTLVRAGTDRARIAAIGALATLAPWFDKPVRAEIAERLTELTRDPIERVRRAAARALPKTEAGAAGVQALEALSKITAKQERPALRRLVQSLKKRDEGGEAAAARKQLEELGEKHQKLEERLQKLEAKLAAHDGEGESEGEGPAPSAGEA